MDESQCASSQQQGDGNDYNRLKTKKTHNPSPAVAQNVLQTLASLLMQTLTCTVISKRHKMLSLILEI